MRRRGELKQVTQLTSVQRARRIAAEAALHGARLSETRARSEEEQARAGAARAHQQWSEHLARPNFSPEYSRCLSAIVIDCEQQLSRAEARVSIAAAFAAARESDWQMRDAQVQLSEASLKRVQRKSERDREEKRLSDIGDRITFAWSRS